MSQTKPSAWASLKTVASSRRLVSVALLSLSSGMPLGLVITAMPAWLDQNHIDIKTIGILGLAQAPWGFKFLWSPLMDRWRPAWLGFRRGWVLVCQVLLTLLSVVLGLMADAPDVAAVAAITAAIAFTSASHDIAYDAYAIEVLPREEQAFAVSARGLLYKAGMLLAGNAAISLAPTFGWKTTFYALGGIYLLLLPVTIFAPEPPEQPGRPQTLGEAVWQPFVGFLARPAVLQLIAFVLLFRLGDSLAGALVTPFLQQRGYDAVSVGVARGAVGLIATFVGTVAGGVVTARLGVGRSLWVGALAQALSNLGYVAIAVVDPSPGVMFAALAVEGGSSALASVGFGVLLMRLTDKRFSATQFALFTSLVGIARTFVGPPAGMLADALGWRDFFLLTVPVALPGMVLLHRFAPWGTDPRGLSGELESLPRGAPWPRTTVVAAAVGSGVLAAAASLLLSELLAAMKLMRGGKGLPFGADLQRLGLPESALGSMDVLSAVVFGVVFAVAVAAYLVARGRQAPAAKSG